MDLSSPGCRLGSLKHPPPREKSFWFAFSLNAQKGADVFYPVVRNRAGVDLFGLSSPLAQIVESVGEKTVNKASSEPGLWEAS